MVAEPWYIVMNLCFALGGLSVFLSNTQARIVNYFAHGMALLGCIAAVLCAVFVFLQGAISIPLPLHLPFESLAVRVDGLSAFFLLAIGVVGCATSVYAMGYSLEYYGRRFSLMAGLFNLFLLSMALVFTVSHVAAFIIAWEVMSVVSFLLVNFEYEKSSNTRAAYIYVVMTHVGTAFIMIAFFLLVTHSGSMDFALLSGSGATDLTRNIVFICAFIGFGTKAGMIPLHIWLPRAHPAAPSHVSALMSGIMIKTAIYGMSRFFLEFLGVGPAWWGGMVLLVAIISCVVGILYALMEHDLKRLLAYSSIENIGIILLGMGAGMVFMSEGYGMLAGLAWTASLYHLFNHAVFKSLLFLGAGAVVHVTHTKNIELLGGLIKKMPYTTVCFLIGAMAIAALPPLNGFIGEWLIFQSLFLLPHAISGVAGKLVGSLLVAVLGLTGALAAACFVKAFGITFLAKPRSKHADQASEVSIFMLVPMGVLAGLCIVLGVSPNLMLPVISSSLKGFSSSLDTDILLSDWHSIVFKSDYSSGGLSMPVVILLLLIGLMLAVLISRKFGKSKVTSGETWTCGTIPTAHMEYTDTGFSKPIRMAFRSILRPQREIIVDDAHSSYYFGRHLSYHITMKNVFIDTIYRPLNERVIHISSFMKRIQAGSVQLYVGYILVVTILVLIWSTRW